MRAGRPVLPDLADRVEIRDAAQGWLDRIDIHTAATDDRPADALLIRPDGCVAWAVTVEEPAERAVTGLRESLSTWVGR
nr:hypothetical protein [Mycolicibacterium hodleri]